MQLRTLSCKQFHDDGAASLVLQTHGLLGVYVFCVTVQWYKSTVPFCSYRPTVRRTPYTVGLLRHSCASCVFV